MGGGVGRAEIKKLRRFNHFSFVFFVGYVQTQPGGGLRYREDRGARWTL